MSDKTATERLRQLLDERGEHYETSGSRTWWGRPVDSRTGEPINVYHNQAQPMGEDRLFVEMQLATPEQAVDATLGRGTCKVVGHGYTACDDIEFHWYALSCDHELHTLWAADTVGMYCPYCGRMVEL